MEMSSRTIRAYNILKARFSEEEAQELLNYFESLPKEGLATKEDIASLRTEVKEDIASFKIEIKEDLASLRVEIERGYFRLVRWIIITGITATGVIGTLIGVLR